MKNKSFKFILTIHSLEGSSVESAAPLIAYGPYTGTYALRLYRKIKKLLETDFEDYEMLVMLTPIKSKTCADKTSIRVIKQELEEYWEIE